VMVINSTNINKTKNHLSSEPNSLNTMKRPRHMTLEIQILAWNKHNNVTGLSRLMEYQPYSLDNWISNGKTYINKRFKKPAQIRFNSKRLHTIATVNDNIHMDSTMVGSMVAICMFINITTKEMSNCEVL
jgi:hypothetical protein